VGPPKKESADSRLGVQNEKGISARRSGIPFSPFSCGVSCEISCGRGVVILLIGCGCGGVGPLKKEAMEGVDSRLGCRNEKGKKERRGTSGGLFDESFSCEEAFEEVDILLGSRECVATSVEDSSRSRRRALRLL